MNGTGGRSRALWLLAGAGAGAAMLFFLDPRQGTRRRAQVRDRAATALHTGRNASGKAARFVKNRIRGFTSGAGSLLHRRRSFVVPSAAAGDSIPTELSSSRLASSKGSWASGPRLLAGTLGSLLLAYGLSKRGRIGMPAAMFGASLLARAVVNAPGARGLPRR